MNNQLNQKQQLEDLLLQRGFANESSPGQPRSSVWLRHPKNSEIEGLQQRLRIQKKGECMSIEVRQVAPGYWSCPAIAFPSKETIVYHTISDRYSIESFLAQIGWS